MLTQTTGDKRQALAGKTHCTACRAPMVRLGPDYTCPTQVNPNQQSCPDNTINADRLLRLVVTQVVGTVMKGPVVEKVTEIIQNEAAETTERLQRHLDQTELTLSELNQREVDLYTLQEQAGEDAPKFTDERNDITNKRAALSYEARNSRREIDSYAFISDEGRVRANAVDVETYLDSASPETTNQLMATFVKSLGVGPRSIELTYRFPMPSQEHPQGRITDMIPRSESDQTGVIDSGNNPDSPATPHSIEGNEWEPLGRQ